MTFHERIAHWKKVLLWITLICSGLILLIWPIFLGLKWVYGGEWNEVRVAWEIKRLEEIKDEEVEDPPQDSKGNDRYSELNSSLGASGSGSGSGSSPVNQKQRILNGYDGTPTVLKGTREGDWLNEWKKAIRNGVARGHRGELEQIQGEIMDGDVVNELTGL